MNAIKEAHYNLGIAYLEAGQYDRAIPEFEAAIKLDADFIGAHCALCRAYLEQGELEKASRAVTTALKLDTTHQPALLLRGTITEAYHDQGKAALNDKRYTEAVAAFQQAITLDADLKGNPQKSPLENTHIHAHLGAAYIGMKAYPNAIDALQNAIALDPDLVDAHYNLGRAYIEQRHFDKAIPHLERAIAISPNLKGAHYNLARAHRASGNWEAATHAVTETLRIDPSHQPAHELANIIKHTHYNRGITYLNDERYSEAVTAFQNAITLDSDFTTAHYNLGLTFLKMEAYPRAVDALRKTVTLDPAHVAAHHALALAYLGQQELGKARDTATAALKLDADYQPIISLLEAIDPSFTRTEEQQDTQSEPDSPTGAQQRTTPRQETHYELGIVYQDAKMYTEAIAEFQKAIDFDPNFVAAYKRLGAVYLETGRLDEAENAAKAALKIDGNSQTAHQLLEAIKQARPTQNPAKSPEQTTALDIPDAKKHYERGEAFLNNKQYNEAAAAFKRVIKVDPNFADAHCGLGIAYLEMGALDDAKTAVEEASRLKANRQLVHELLTAIKHAETRLRKRERWKKRLAYAVVLGITAILVFVFWPKGPKPLNPDLSIAASLSAPYLLAGKTETLILTIKNRGGTAQNIKIRLQPKDKTGLNYELPAPIPIMGESGAERIKIPITGNKNIRTRKETLKIELATDDRIEPVTYIFDLQIFGTER